MRDSEGLAPALADWCRSYVQAFESFDADAIGRHWSFPALIFSSGRQITFTEASGFNRNTSQLIEFYKRQNVSRVNRLIDSVFQISAVTAAMRVNDQMYSGDNEFITGWSSGYVLKQDGVHWRAIWADASGEVEAWVARGTPLGT
ncbi:MAG: hypothetical protein AAF683_10785 [Pseudomonadota bacterium]